MVLVAEPGTASLIDVGFHPHRTAANGGPGEGGNKHGPSAPDVIVPVPLGTVVLTEDGQQVADPAEPGERFVAARGGRGGLGNAALASRRRRPLVSRCWASRATSRCTCSS